MTLPRRTLTLRTSAATLHVVGPVASLAPVAFSVVRIRPDGRSMRRHGPSRRPVGPCDA